MKNILITGVSRGIGRAMASHFAGSGYFVYGGYKWSSDYRDEEKPANELAAQLGDVELLPFDLADRNQTHALVKRLNGVKLAAIINNAGEFIPNSWEDFDFKKWDRVMEVNSVAPLVIVEGLKDNLISESAVVNIASTDAYYAGYDDIAYAASKASLMNLTKSLAAMMASRKVRVNAIAPGWVDTAMAEQAAVHEHAHYKSLLGRNATPQEITDVVEFLISSKAAFINATIVNVDGGYASIDDVVKREAGY